MSVLKFKSISIILLLAAVVLASPKPTDENKKDRAFKDEDLSSEEHNPNDEHNKEYDHEAFLGKEESKKFDELTPEQSKDRLE